MNKKQLAAATAVASLFIGVFFPSSGAAQSSPPDTDPSPTALELEFDTIGSNAAFKIDLGDQEWPDEVEFRITDSDTSQSQTVTRSEIDSDGYLWVHDYEPYTWKCFRAEAFTAVGGEDAEVLEATEDQCKWIGYELTDSLEGPWVEMTAYNLPHETVSRSFIMTNLRAEWIDDGYYDNVDKFVFHTLSENFFHSAPGGSNTVEFTPEELREKIGERFGQQDQLVYLNTDRLQHDCVWMRIIYDNGQSSRWSEPAYAALPGHEDPQENCFGSDSGS